MSWVQQHNKQAIVSPPSSTNASSSAITYSSSPLLLNLHSSANNNSSSYNTTNRNANSLRQVSQPLTNTALLQPSITLPMASQYSNKANTSIKSPTATSMRINPTSPYQPLAQQQLHQQQPSTTQRHHQHQLNNVLQQPTSQVPYHTTTAASSTVSHLQGVSDNSSHQQNSWPAQQTGYMPSAKMMHPTATPPAVPPAVPPAQITASNNWPQPPPQQSFQNANMYQPNVVPQQHQQWPQNQPQANNYYQQQANNNNLSYQQQQPLAPPQQMQQQVGHHNVTTYFQPQPPQSKQIQSNPVNFFDQSNNNPKASADGWGDWDWNDNSTVSVQPADDQDHTTTAANSQALLKTQPLNQQQTNYNSSILVDSFDTQNSNDSWNWMSKENEQQVPNVGPKILENQKPNDIWNSQSNDKEKVQQKFATQVPPANELHNDNRKWHVANENQEHVTPIQNLPEMNNITSKTAPAQLCATPPPPPPPTEFSSLAPENHNYNTNTSASPPNNIPNTVFVTQAKPVTLPSRQYASPPTGNTPTSENPPETTLMPPQGFENVEETISAVVSTALPHPEVVAPPLTNATPPIGLPTVPHKNGNPFKRSGVAQHHRATGLISTSGASVVGQLAEPVAFNMPPPPPPPADFANPGAVTLMEPDNNELPSQENQQVLAHFSSQIISLPVATIQTSSTISMPINTVTQAPAPPNDERNQYLQTSHLSENSEEHQPEIDGLLPPPGLSRLVLGEPELEASQQRMVMGTEAINTDSALTQAAVMHLEERHADGEDTASENAVPLTISVGQGVASNSSTLSSDRNLYMVPGESNTAASNNQQQRVVTGVELAEQREIEMDGENLEDEQVLQQQQHLQQQNQHQHSVLPAEARNEPPVEGADDTVIAPPPLAVINTSHGTDQHLDNQYHHSSNQLTKTKDSNPISSPNDDDNSDERMLNDRGMNQSNAGSSKSRSKYESERLVAASRRRDKHSSAERYESDEYLNSECEYSSEREERERRERDRRRNYREGSVRSDRGVNEEDEKRSRRHRAANKRDKYYYEGEERTRGGRDDRPLDRSKTERRSHRQHGYDIDSRYETEESTRFDSRKDALRRSTRRGDRGEPVEDYDEYNQRAGYRSSKRPVDNYESDRRDRRRSDKHREPRYREDPRYDPREYEDYRKHSSRNARESDMEKEGAMPSRSGRMHHDPRQAAAMYGYSSSGYYDPYTAYYYQQMARTNPQAYAEWYKKYYGQAAAGATQSGSDRNVSNAGNVDVSLAASGNDGRESVHSGRSSAHNDIKDRYTHAYITQANDYHRHYQQQQHLHQQHLHQQQQQMAFNQSLNSTMLDEETLNRNTSIYSGLGSLSLTRSNTNISQIHGGYYMPATASTAAGVYYARSDYAESRNGALTRRDPDSITQDPQRLTPCKFITEHAVVTFASGILVTVKPKYTPNGSISNVVKLLKFKPNDETRKLFKVFPGPLVRGLTHKKTVIEFCQDQIRLGPLETTIYAKQLITNNAEKYRGSYTLMWNLLILLLKQNGMVVGTDIAELLLKNQQQFPYQTPVSTANNSTKSKSLSNSLEDLNANKETHDLADALTKTANLDESSAAAEKLQADEDFEDNSLVKSSSDSMSLTEEEITEKFRNYLLYGNVNEALEWATDNNLWGHALFLASKLDRRSHANVMMKFANKLSLNDPLQTLYQLMSGRSPSSVTCVQDEKWGDWRPHLSMILSNTSQKPELDRKAITTLGDSLFNRGDLYAAHFCYLMAQVGFGRYQETATQETSLQQHLPRLVLLGSSHYKQFKNFAHNEAIVMTEIYEYACSLNDDKFSIIEFQPYKFLFATRLLDYGFHLKSLMYLEQIAVHIAIEPNKYGNSFIHKVYEMAERLKYYDPALEKIIEDQQGGSDDNAGANSSSQQIEEQKWLQNLRQLAQQYKNDGNTSAPAPVILYQEQPQSQDPSYYNQQQQIDQQFMEINKQFSELNLQYQQQTTANIEQQQQQPMFYTPEQQQQQLQEQPTLDSYRQQQEQQQPLPTELATQNTNDLHHPTESLQNVYQQHPPYLQPDVAQQSAGYNPNYYDPSQYSNAVDASANNLDKQQPPNYDYWSQQQPLLNQPTEENTRPTISMPKSKTYDTDDDNTANKSLGQQHHAGNGANKTQQQQQQQLQQQQQKGAKKEDLSKNLLQQSNQNSGWFGGIWNKFSLKPKNQMILPDDKNPSIVWDPERKKWVNTDGEEDAQEAFKPPPKMSDLMPQQQQQQVQQQQVQQPQIVPQQQQTQTNQVPFMDIQQIPQQQQQHEQQPQLPQLQQYAPNTIAPQAAPSPNPVQQQQQNLNPSQTQYPGPAKTPTLQSNMFKMQRNRTLKNAYVDVFNPSGAPINKAAENILAPALPPAAVPQGGFFIPGSQLSTASGAGTSQEQQYQQQQQQQQPQQQDAPQFYNPNQFTSGTGY